MRDELTRFRSLVTDENRENLVNLAPRSFVIKFAKLASPLPPLSASSEVSAPRDLKLIARCKQIYVTADKLLEKEKRFCHARDLRLLEAE